MTLDEAIKDAEEVARQNEEDAIIYSNCKKHKKNLYEIGLAENAEKKCYKCAEEHRQLAEWLKELKQLREQTRWIPITKRPMTEDEKQWYESCYDEAEILNCPLPEDGEDVLITAYGRTWIDTFLRDETDGCYFESYDINVDAWMPLPKPYKAESEVQE